MLNYKHKKIFGIIMMVVMLIFIFLSSINFTAFAESVNETDYFVNTEYVNLGKDSPYLYFQNPKAFDANGITSVIAEEKSVTLVSSSEVKKLDNLLGSIDNLPPNSPNNPANFKIKKTALCGDVLLMLLEDVAVGKTTLKFVAYNTYTEKYIDNFFIGTNGVDSNYNYANKLDFKVDEIVDIEFDGNDTLFVRTYNMVCKFKFSFNLSSRDGITLIAGEMLIYDNKLIKCVDMAVYGKNVFFLIETEIETEKATFKNNVVYKWKENSGTCELNFLIHPNLASINDKPTDEQVFKNIAISNEYVYLASNTEVYAFHNQETKSPTIGKYPISEKEQVKTDNDTLTEQLNKKDKAIGKILDMQLIGEGDNFTLLICDSQYQNIKLINPRLVEVIKEVSGETTRSKEFRLIATKYYGSSGDEIDRLNKPNSVALTKDGTNMFIADTVNNRILNYYYSITIDKKGNLVRTLEKRTEYKNGGYSFVQPYLVETDNTNVYIVDSNNIQIMQLEKVDGLPTLKFSKKIDTPSYGQVKDIKLVGNVIYFLFKNNTKYSIYKYEKESLVLCKEYNDKEIISIAASSGVSLYVMTKSIIAEKEVYQIDILSVSNNYLEQAVKVNVLGAIKPVSFEVDFKGNIFVLDNGIKKDATLNYQQSSVIKLTREENGYSSSIKRYYSNGKHISNANSLRICDKTGEMFVANTSRHTIIKFTPESIGVSVEGVNDYKHPTTSQWDIVQVSKLNFDTAFSSSPDNYETVDILQKNSYVLVLSLHTYKNNQFYYIVKENGTLGYIKKSEMNFLLPSEKADIGDFATPLHYSSGATVYQFPFSTAKVLTTIKYGEQIKIVNDVAADGAMHVWQSPTIKWFKVSFKNIKDEDVIGYIKKSDLIPFAQTTPQEPTKVKLKIKSSVLGEKVKMYILPDLASGILNDSISDGTILYLMEDEFNPDNMFTKVMLGGQVGYILTEHLITGGLTTSQIVGLICACAVFSFTLVGVIIFVVRKKRG